MKKKIIFGFLVLVILLFFLAQSWAIDWRRAQQQYYERPDQEFDRIPVPPKTTVKNFPFIKFLWLPGMQNIPTLILIDKSINQTEPKDETPVRNIANPDTKTIMVGQDE